MRDLQDREEGKGIGATEARMGLLVWMLLVPRALMVSPPLAVDGTENQNHTRLSILVASENKHFLTSDHNRGMSV